MIKSLSYGIVIAAIGFAGILTVLIGNRLSNEAMAVVVGAVCGISASIPVSIALVIAASRNWGREPGDTTQAGYNFYEHRYYPQPAQILVVSPQGSFYLAPGAQADAPVSREYKIVGDEGDARGREVTLSPGCAKHGVPAGRICPMCTRGGDAVHRGVIGQ